MDQNQTLPGFVVIGAMRAGTTTLYELFRASGLISVPSMKETDFFITEANYARGTSWLRSQFSDLSKPSCDFSPNYSRRQNFPLCAERIKDTLPDVKLIYVVRDPVERAVSQYRHMCAMGFDMPKPNDLEGHKEGDEIIQTSRYAYQLDAYLEHFSLGDILIVDFQDLVSNQVETLQVLLRRMGLTSTGLELDDVQANSSDDLERLPSFWGKLRRTKLGDSIRATLPRSFINTAKTIAAKLSPDRPVEPFEPAAREHIRLAVSQDAQRFREMTGLAFSDWSV